MKEHMHTLILSLLFMAPTCFGMKKPTLLQSPEIENFQTPIDRPRFIAGCPICSQKFVSEDFNGAMECLKICCDAHVAEEERLQRIERIEIARKERLKAAEMKRLQFWQDRKKRARDNHLKINHQNG